MHKAAIPSLLALAALIACRPAAALEGGTSTYLHGYKDFLSGIVPPEEGWYFRNDLVYYTGDISRTVIGGRVSVGLSEELVAELPAASYVAPFTILGANYAFAIAVPIEGVSVDASAAGPRRSIAISDGATNFGDLFINPIFLGWHFGNFHLTAGFGMTAPAGEYSKGALADTGFNRWSYLPQLAFTYFDPASGWDFSVAPTYDINDRNSATDYQSGEVFDLDWAVGKQLTPEWKIGITGYWLQQTTPDSGSGAKLGANEASVWALGPIASYNFAIGAQHMSGQVKWTHEIEATRAIQGDTVTATLSLKF